jgi:hypothetical protein
MYKVLLFQYKSQFNTVFNINPGNQASPIAFFFFYYFLFFLFTMSHYGKLVRQFGFILYIFSKTFFSYQCTWLSNSRTYLII